MSRIVFLVEERSMKTLLEGLLLRLMPELPFICIPHEGKQDLERSIPRKLKAWQEPGVRFIIIRDNDGGNCKKIKENLLELCCNAGRPNTIVRLACQELEAWYFGDTAALAKAFEQQTLVGIKNKARYRIPDSIQKPSAELKRLIPGFQKISGARRMAKHLSRDGNRSNSFNITMNGIERAFASFPMSPTKL